MADDKKAPIAAVVTEKSREDKLADAQKKCDAAQDALTKANDAAVKAHLDLMAAQREMAAI